ncbi:PTS system mannose/fructose/N-acetylgalactosamine-transporter subunit IIB [Propionispora vibrioides]|uniref:PTS system, mannose-specific IIB component n=1 Tax=Propionispora vibrioides TaxID=112903 RepID=A0A1H8SHS6_9FIRM|nr:PTS sugar transporter subunit IIB [Propionispora vibrioides]SEO78232.1 PTS system, mannose-specific IIB component [Propionispora vibrioides]
MKNIVVARVDDRLIHGEVVTAWAPSCNATRIVIVDELVEKDPFNKRIIKALAPSGITVDVFSVEQGINDLKGNFDAGERILILTKSPITFEALIDGGVGIKEVILGGMGLRGERKPFIKNVSCSPEEVDSIRNMINKGIDVYYQLVPDQRSIDIKNLL